LKPTTGPEHLDGDRRVQLPNFKKVKLLVLSHEEETSKDDLTKTKRLQENREDELYKTNNPVFPVFR